MKSLKLIHEGYKGSFSSMSDFIGEKHRRTTVVNITFSKNVIITKEEKEELQAKYLLAQI